MFLYSLPNESCLSDHNCLILSYLKEKNSYFQLSTNILWNTFFLTKPSFYIYCFIFPLGLSTALANAKDLADWLGIEGQTGLYNFRPSVRPVPLEVHISGYPGKHYCPRMISMNKPAFQAIQQHSPNKPTLIFVSSRRQTRLTALDLIALSGNIFIPTLVGVNPSWNYCLDSKFSNPSYFVAPIFCQPEMFQTCFVRSFPSFFFA